MHGLAVFRFVFVEAAAVDDAGQDFLHVVGTRRRRIDRCRKFLPPARAGGCGFLRSHGDCRRYPHLLDDGANAREAGFVVGLAKIHRAADRGVHGRAAQFFGGNLLADGGLHQRRPGKKQSAAVGHQHVIAHHGQVAAAGHAHAHDGRDLRNSHGRHHRVVAEDAAEIVGVGKDVFLQRQKHAGGIHQVDRRHAIFDRDVLRANDLLRGHGEERAGLHGGVVGDDHHQAGLNARQAGDDAGGGAPPHSSYMPWAA